MLKISFIIAIVLSLTSCSNVQQSGNNIQEQGVDQFESLMTDLTRLYPQLPSTRAETIEYKEIYRLRKRIFYPDIFYVDREPFDLTLELRETLGGGWKYKVIYAYNDSFNFVLPLTDYYFFWVMSGNKPLKKKEFEENLCFETELNKLLNITKASNKFKVQRIVDLIMTDMLNYYPVSMYDIPTLMKFANNISESNFIYNDSCRSKIIDNVNIIESKLNKQNNILYTNGVLTHIITINEVDNKEIKCEIESLNNECLAILIW